MNQYDPNAASQKITLDILYQEMPEGDIRLIFASGYQGILYRSHDGFTEADTSKPNFGASIPNFPYTSDDEIVVSKLSAEREKQTLDRLLEKKID